MGGRGGINEKKQKGNEIKAKNKAIKQSREASLQEQKLTQEWNVGSNAKKVQRDELAASRADEAAKKRAEKAALLAAEEEGMKGTTKQASKNILNTTKTKTKKKKKKKGGNDISLLESSLIGDADKKAKDAKKKERLRKEREERLQKERDRVASSASTGASAVAVSGTSSTKKDDILLSNTDSMLGDTTDIINTHELQTKQLNASMKKNGSLVDASGMDAALSVLSVNGNGGPGGDIHPEKRMKALHLAFEERMMTQMKEEYPGLKRSQYKEKIFNLWKKSPENPLNWTN